jgi:hypothetical protein
MYHALWRILPGAVWLKLLQLLALGSGVLALLFYVVFPFIAQTLLPEQSTVG